VKKLNLICISHVNRGCIIEGASLRRTGGAQLLGACIIEMPA